MNRLSSGFEIDNDTTDFFDFIQINSIRLDMRVLNPFVRTSDPVVGPISEAPGGSLQCRPKAEAFYSNYGVYRSIKCTFHYQARSAGFWLPKKTNVKLSWIGNEVDTKCVIRVKNGNMTHYLPALSLYNSNHNASHLKWKPYSGSKRVEEGSTYATFSYEDINTGQYETITTNILTF